MIFVGADLPDFFTFKGAKVDFDEGLTMLVGPNGSGKTALAVEVVCWVLWGKTARGADPVPDGDASMTVLNGGRSVSVRRSRSGNRLAGLALAVDGVATNGQTHTETQAKIDALVGDWRLFSSTRVFSRALLSRFSNAANRDRGKLLESVLGLERFTRSEKFARGALALRRSAALVAEGQVREARAALERSQQAAANAAPQVDVAALRRELERIGVREKAATDSAAALAAKIERMEAVVRSARESWVAAKAKAEASRQQARDGRRSLVAGGPCPTCERPLTPQVVEAANVAQAERAEKVMFAARRDEEIMESAKEELLEQEDVLRVLKEERSAPGSDYRSERSGIEKEIARAEGVAEQEERARRMVEVDTKRVDRTQLELAKANRDLRVVEAACEALGPRGARLRVFSRAMGAINAEVAQVLAKLGLGIRVRITGTKTNASGEESDEVSVEVEGAGAGRYLGASDGERARIDVAILLGLARVAGARGVLVFDEVFDPLDDEGVERVAELLQDMAKDRQVIVTTHNERLRAILPAALTWRVSKQGGASSVAAGG